MPRHRQGGIRRPPTEDVQPCATQQKTVILMSVLPILPGGVELALQANILASIRKPVAQVFEALVNPAITSNFWFSKSSGPLEVGKQVRWDWEMYGHHTTVDVKAIDDNKRILIEWNGPENPSLVEWTFESRDKDRTFVTVKNWGFKGETNKVVSEAIDSTGGFSFLLAALKAYLEHGIELNLVLDHAPDLLVQGWALRHAAA